jgi:hypothetical protein
MAFGPILCVGECYYQSEHKLSEEIRRLKLLPVPVPFTKRAFFLGCVRTSTYQNIYRKILLRCDLQFKIAI